MTNNNFSPNAISHKELNSLFNKAKKENAPSPSSTDNEIIQNEEFNNLISNWSDTSQKILLMLLKKEKIITKNRNPKSVMAFGAMGAHINMALQALKAAELDQ